MSSENQDASSRETSYDRAKKATPLPKKKVAVVCLVMFADFYGVLLIFPFLPFMVSDFFPELDRTEIGKKAGFLGSAYYIGCLAGSFTWGWLADIIGRRPTMLFCILGVIVSFTLFGFSQNFAWAVCSRLLWGTVDGIVGISKTYISEICDDTNQARGFALITTMGGFGRLFGSLTGGFLARPASKYSAFNTPFFCSFPYVLPCLVGVAANIISLIMAWLFLHETLKKPDRKGDTKKLSVSIATTNDGDVINDSMETVNNNDLISDLEKGGEHQPLLGSHGRKKTNVVKLKRLLKKARHKLITVANLIKDRNVFLSTALYGLLGFAVIIFNEVFPLLMVTDHHHGGYDMDDNEIGIFLSIAAVFQISYQVFLYPLIAKLIGYRNTFRFGAALFTIGCILLPLSNHISGPIGNSQSDNSNSTHGINATTWTITTDNNIVAIGDHNDNHLWTFSTLYGSKYQSQRGVSFNNSILNSVEYYGDYLLDNNSTNDSCHNSHLGSLVGKNSVKRIPARVWLTISWIVTMCSIGRLTGFTSISVIIGNSALPATRGTVNGIGQTLAALGRSTGPLVGTPVFAWSERNGHEWPLNYYFIYEVITLMVIFIVLLSFALPKSSEKKRVPQPKTQTATINHLSKKQSSVT